jgi:hypothetical protein
MALLRGPTQGLYEQALFVGIADFQVCFAGGASADDRRQHLKELTKSLHRRWGNVFQAEPQTTAAWELQIHQIEMGDRRPCAPGIEAAELA